MGLPEARRLVLKPYFTRTLLSWEGLRLVYGRLLGRKLTKNQRVRVRLFGRTVHFTVDSIKPNPAMLGPRTRFGVWVKGLKVNDDTELDLRTIPLPEQSSKLKWRIIRERNKRSYKVKKKEEGIKEAIKWPRDWGKKLRKKHSSFVNGLYVSDQWLEHQLKQQLKETKTRLKKLKKKQRKPKKRRRT